MQGPAIFLAQFLGNEPPFDNLANISRWAGELGYVGVQVPTTEPSLMDLQLAAESTSYCDELKGICAENGVQITELSTHLQGQLVAVGHRAAVALHQLHDFAATKLSALNDLGDFISRHQLRKWDT